MTDYHIPALLKESIEGLAINPSGVYVDLTFGGGGHSKAIINQLVNGKLFAFDQDEDSKQNAIQDERFVFVNHNFKFLRNFLRYYNINKVDGILADLGVSSHHFDSAGRGFSFRQDGPLDMRMNQQSKTNAAIIVNEYTDNQLISIFRVYGELSNAKVLTDNIANYRKSHKINTVYQLLEAIKPCTPHFNQHKFLAKVFQAIRIEVNQELAVLQQLLCQVTDILNPKGRIVIITYHSLEDRLVKNYFASGNFEGKVEKDFYGNLICPFKPINRKVIVPSEEEIASNPRARSAKLRIAEKL